MFRSETRSPACLCRYKQYGGFDEVFNRYYKRVAEEFILPVQGVCDLVLEKGAPRAADSLLVDGSPQR